MISPLLQVHDLSKAYGEHQVLKNISFSLFPSSIYALMGTSGIGKTTILRILMGLEKADQGHFFWNGIPWDPYTSLHKQTAQHNTAPRISAVFQEDRLCESFSPLLNLSMAVPKETPKDVLIQEMMHLLPEESLERPVSTLSGGMKRRTAILRALLCPFDLLILDEPFTGLDPQTKEAVIQYMLEKTAGKLVLFTTHQKEELPLLKAVPLHFAAISQ